jgi:lysophospholipase L1-like esterase
MVGSAPAVAAPAVAESRPTAAVSLGDSAASGEGARNYESGTNQSGNFCHRSLDSYIHETSIPGIDTTINLACSGARSTHLQIGGGSRYGENQAAMLAEVAAQYDVELVTVQIGANDDPGFGETVLECVIRWAAIVGPGCRDTIGAEWPDRVEAMKPKVANAVTDVRKVMSDAGYAESDYELVLVSYASPVTENMRLLTHALEGCPIRIADAKWGRTVATVMLNDALRDVAQGFGVRFLDLSRATEGRGGVQPQRVFALGPCSHRRGAGRGVRDRRQPGPGVVPPERSRARPDGRVHRRVLHHRRHAGGMPPRGGRQPPCGADRLMIGSDLSSVRVGERQWATCPAAAHPAGRTDPAANASRSGRTASGSSGS